jgi:CubicO group peptidase (beta-lactamase class C family)
MHSCRFLGMVIAGVLGALFDGLPGHAATAPASIAPVTLPPDGNPALWTHEQAIVGYRNIAKLYGGDVVHHGEHVMPLERASHQLDVQYESGGKRWNVDEFMKHNWVAGLVVLHKGKIVLERYRLGFTEHDQWVSFSVAKSVTSTLLGVGVHEHLIQSIDDPVTRYIPALTKSGYEGVTLQQALTMSVGLRWVEDYKKPDSDWGRSLSLDIPGDARPAVDPVEYMAKLPRVSKPGSVFLYNSGNAHILGIAVESATRRTLAAYLEEKIWKPVGMEADAYWVRDRLGHDLGRSMLNATSRDYARFGYFFMHGCRIGGTSIVPAGWVEDASRAHLQTNEGDGYGYEWWISPNGRSYSAIGIFGQMIFLDPKADVVIVTQSAWPEADWNEGYAADTAFTDAVVQGAARFSN